MAGSAESARFASRFACIGGACEDSCCSFNWSVGLSRDDYSRLKAAVSGSLAERARFERGCARTPGARAGDRSFATLQRTPEGSCVFLAADRRCSIQTAHGWAVLPEVCATYPRVLTRIGDRLSLTDTLSCPEAARLCLLGEDTCALEPADPASLEGLLERRRVPRAGHGALVRHYLPVRDAFLELLARAEYPVRSRLVFTLHLARCLDGARDGKAQAAAPDLREVIRTALAPTVLNRLHRECRAVTAPGSVPFDLVEQILHVLLQRQHASRLAALVHAVRMPHARDRWPAADPEEPRAAPPPGPDLAAAYLRSRAAWDGAYGDRIGRYVANYVANLWLQEPFTGSPDLTTHALGHLARVAAVRFLLLMHPALRELGPPDAGDARHRETLDRAVVEVVYTFARAVEHGAAMGTLLEQIVAQHRAGRRRRALELAVF